jgi:DNA-binding transcriptional LysR family regulator
LPRAGTPLRRLIEEGLRRRGVGVTDVTPVLETDGVGLMVQAVRVGLGLAFVPQMRLPRTRDVGVVELAGVNLQQDWYVLRSRERGAPRAVQELFGFIAGKDTRKLLTKEGLKPPAD